MGQAQLTGYDRPEKQRFKASPPPQRATTKTYVTRSTAVAFGGGSGRRRVLRAKTRTKTRTQPIVKTHTSPPPPQSPVFQTSTVPSSRPYRLTAIQQRDRKIRQKLFYESWMEIHEALENGHAKERGGEGSFSMKYPQVVDEENQEPNGQMMPPPLETPGPQTKAAVAAGQGKAEVPDNVTSSSEGDLWTELLGKDFETLTSPVAESRGKGGNATTSPRPKTPPLLSPPPPKMNEAKTPPLLSPPPESHAKSPVSAQSGMPPPPPLVNTGMIPPPPPLPQSLHSALGTVAAETSAGVPPPPPPGLLAGGVPPPPPFPGSGMAAAAAPKAAPVPSGPRMKRFHWTPLREGEIGQESVWSEIGAVDEESVECDMMSTTLKESFLPQSKPVQKRKRKASSSRQKRASKASKKQKLVCIDERRACNIGIGLAGIKLSPTGIARAVTELDNETLGADALNRLVKIFPTTDELKQIRRFKGDASGLDKAEQLLAAISKAPQPHAHLQVMLLMSEFKSRSDGIEARYEQLRAACARVRGSDNLKKFLRTVLRAGNLMNAGRGGVAAGFNLAALRSLKSIKTNDRKATLLHLIISHIRSTEAEVETGLMADLALAREAMRLDSRCVQQDVDFVQNNMDFLKNCLKMFTSPPAKAKAFLKDATIRWAEVCAARETALREFKHTIAFFRVSGSASLGADPKDDEWRSFFSVWTQLAADIEAVGQELTRKARQAERKKKQTTRVKKTPGSCRRKRRSTTQGVGSPKQRIKI